MDALDVRIVRELGIMPFSVWPHPPTALKPRAIAERLHVSVDAVKDRLRGLERDGVIRGYEIYPNFRHFGLQLASYRFRLTDEAKRVRATQDAENADGVFLITGFLGSDVCIDICHRSPQELQRRMSLLSRLMGDATPTAFYEYALPPVPRELSPLDWRILQAMRGDPRRSLDELADDIGVSGRTVKRRYERMAQEGAFDIVANFDPGALQGYTLFLLMLSLRPGATERESRSALNAFGDRWFYSWSPPGLPNSSIYAAMLGASMGEIEAVRREAETISVVARAETLVPVDLRSNARWIDEAIAERARAGSRIVEADERHSMN